MRSLRFQARVFPTDADALFAAILARPSDDVARLMFADAIEETGHPAAAARASYIRASVELARTADSAERARLQRIADGARPGFADEVDGAVRASGLVQYQIVRSRGFAESLHGPEESLPVVAAALGRLAPWRLVWLDGTEQGVPLDWLDYLPRFGGLEELVFTWTLPGYVLPAGPVAWHDRVARLLDHDCITRMPRLARLGFVRMGLADDWLVYFLSQFRRSAWARQITALDLRDNHFTDRAANLLASAEGLADGFALDLRWNRITPAGQELMRRRFGEGVRF